MLEEGLRNNLPIEYIFEKPFRIEELIERIKYIERDISKSSIRMEEDFNKILFPLNFNVNTLGYTYLLECITVCTQKRYKYIFKMKDVYFSVSKLNGELINPKNIKWNVDKAVKNMLNNTDKEILKRFFETTDMPTTKKIISRVLEIIKDQEK